MKIKICGLRTLDDVKAVNDSLPDYAGFVFVPGRKRTISQEQAAVLKKALDKRIKAVGVFQDAPLEEPFQLLQNGTIDIAQLHGNEHPRYVHHLKIISGAPIIKAFIIHSSSDIKSALYSHADILLLDAGAGDGKTFDWSLLEGFPRPYLLAGGLSPANVAQAIERCHPWGVDVSSGVETNGVKSPQKIHDFIEICRSMNKKSDA